MDMDIMNCLFAPKPAHIRADDFLPSSCGKIVNNNKLSAIIYGDIARIQDSPWQVALLRKQNNCHFCGGSVISVKHVVTAAHCLHTFEKEEVFVFAGSANLNAAGSKFGILDVYIHDEYNSITLGRDIALVIIHGSFQFGPTIQPICLPAEGEIFNPGERCTITGWGRTERYLKPERLRTAQVKIWAEPECKKVHGQSSLDGMVCAVGEEGQDTCRGDSGGPLACLKKGIYKLFGVTSWGPSVCGRRNYPGVYTRVPDYIRWIKDKVEVSIDAGVDEDEW